MLPVSERVQKDLFRVFEESFGSRAKGRVGNTSRGFPPAIQVRLKLFQGSRKSRKPSRSVLGSACERFVVVHHQSETEKLERVLMSLLFSQIV